MNEIQGDVLGPAIQARDIHGGIHVHQGQPATPVPCQLPPPVHLCGRTRDLAALDAACGSRTVIISGPAGIGKSALAVRWGHARRAGYPDGQLFADLRGHAPDGPVAAGDVLARFLRALGVPPQNVPAELAELTAMYRSVTSDRRVVVVLDDAISAAQVRPLLPASSDSVALITSRWRLTSLVVGGARSIQLDRLESGAAYDLLSQVIGGDRVAAEAAAARELAGLCAYFPLTLCISAARLAVRPKWQISELVTALRVERHRLSAFTAEDDIAMQAALDLSYRALPAEVARMYRLMGLFPGVSFDSQVAAAATVTKGPAARRLLGVLADANMLDDAAGGHYRFHDLIRLHAFALAEEEEGAVRDTAVRRMLDWYLVTAAAAGQLVLPYRHDQSRDIRYPPAEPRRFADADEALEWLEQELPNLSAMIRFAARHGYPGVAWQAVDALWPLFLRRGHYRERLELDQIGLAAARSSGAVTAEAKMLGRLGLALIGLGRLDEAAECCTKALALWRTTGNERRAAGCLRRLGLVEQARDQPENALAFFGQALDGYRQLDESRAAALTLADMGTVLTDLGRTTEALEHLRRARALLAAIPDPYNEARALAALGHAQGIGGQRQTAAQTLEQALLAMRGLRSLPGEASVLQLLGDLAVSAGEREEARRMYEAALAILDQVGSPNAAQVRDRLGRLEEAR